MDKNIWILLIEDDIFARSMMELLFRRDWRTNVVGQVANMPELERIFLNRSGQPKKRQERIDLALIDIDHFSKDPRWLSDVLAALNKFRPGVRIMLTGGLADGDILADLKDYNLAGYLLKEEIRYSLAWAASLSMFHPLILTTGTQVLLKKMGYPIPDGTIVLNGNYSVANLTEHETEVARMAFLFSLERRELSDELGISVDYSYGLISMLYEKVGMKELLNGEVDPVEYLGKHSSVNSHFESILEHMRHSSKGKDLESLAFHLLTMPDMQKIK